MRRSVKTTRVGAEVTMYKPSSKVRVVKRPPGRDYRGHNCSSSQASTRAFKSCASTKPSGGSGAISAEGDPGDCRH
jgi:hypothetical protein